MNRPLLLSLNLFFYACAFCAVQDSPVFVVKNQPVPATTAIAPQPTRAVLPNGTELGISLEGSELSFNFTRSMGYVLDPHASPGCSPALVGFADNSALLIWRGHGADNLRDLLFARYVDGQLQSASRLSFDDWRTGENPAGEGPALDSRGAHVAVAWFTAADGPRVNVSTSSNAGAQWLMPNRVDDVAPIGRVSVVLLDDGAQLVSWVERRANDYAILLRRVSPRGTLSASAELVRQSADPGHPLLTRVKDGDATPAQLLLTYTSAGKPAARLITLPPAAQLAESDACDCDPRPEDQRGYAIKGRIVSIHPDLGTLSLAHDAVPGVLKAATTTLHAAPDLLASAKTGARILARIERIGPDWWLFNPRTLITP